MLGVAVWSLVLTGCGAQSRGCMRSHCPESAVPIPGGTFMMGEGNPLQAFGAGPAHREEVGSFCMDRTEVTAGAYAACTDPGCGAQEVGTCADGAEHPSYPRNCVTWEQADAYCRWQGGRLPTETEWEFAARGTDGRLYPWGNQEPDETRANWGGTYGLRRLYTRPVGSYPAGASPYGVQDMVGNVAEWVTPTTSERSRVRGSAYDSTTPDRLVVTDSFTGDERGSPDTGFRCAFDL
jgi:sulfatase modifying factor 1